MTAGPFQLGLFAPKTQASGGVHCDGWQVSEAAIWRQGDVVPPEDNLSRVAPKDRELCARRMVEYAREDGQMPWAPAKLDAGRIVWVGGSAAVDACYLPALVGRIEVEVMDEFGQHFSTGGDVGKPLLCCRIRAWQGNTLMAVVMPCRE